jgi:hypothetical protein
MFSTMIANQECSTYSAEIGSTGTRCDQVIMEKAWWRCVLSRVNWDAWSEEGVRRRVAMLEEHYRKNQNQTKQARGTGSSFDLEEGERVWKRAHRVGSALNCRVGAA